MQKLPIKFFKPAPGGPPEILSAFQLRVVQPIDAEQPLFDIPETSLKGRSIEVGSLPGKGFKVVGLEPVHFYLVTAGSIIKIFPGEENNIKIDGAKIPGGEYSQIKPGAEIECSGGIILQVIQAKSFTGYGISNANPEENKVNSKLVGVLQPLMKGLISANFYKGTVKPPASIGNKMLRLKIKANRYGASGEKIFPCKDGQIIEIGREPKSNISLVVKDKAVSRRHAYIKIEGTEVFLYDGDPETEKDSYNGTNIYNTLRGKSQISPKVGYKILPGTVIQVGHTKIRLEEVNWLQKPKDF